MLSPNPPNEGDTATERRCWGERARLSGLHRSRTVDRERAAIANWIVEGSLQSPPGTGWRYGTQHRTLADWAGASLRGRWVAR